MRFLVCEKQNGYGCDYTIGCGMRYYFAESESVEELEKRIVWPSGEDEYSVLEGDDRLVDIIIVPAEYIHSVDLEKYRHVVKEKNHKWLNEKIRNDELAELERLQRKYASK